GCPGLHERPLRHTGHGKLDEPGRPHRGRARAGQRHLAALPAMPCRRTSAHRSLHPRRHLIGESTRRRTMTIHSRRPVAGLSGAAVPGLATAGGAFAHAIVSPPVAKAQVLQQFTLAVPTEKEGTTTTKIELTVPAGFAIDSFEPAPAGWKQDVRST